MPDNPATDTPIPMDLPDFIPEVYEPKFKICGHLYAFRYEEATVDEVFRLLAKNAIDDPAEIPAMRRKVVTEFLKSHMTEGDPGQFEEDMKRVPYHRPGAPIDIERLYQPLMLRVKKNGLGESLTEGA